MVLDGERAEAHDLRTRTQRVFGVVEEGLYIAVALALSIAGLALLGYVVYDSVAHLGGTPFTSLILELLDGLLLVFIVTELIHTIRAVIQEKVLVSEPFLVVGIVALIRRLVVVSAEAKELVGTPKFVDAMLEIGILAAGVIALGLTIFLLRHTGKSEPEPRHEPE